MLRTFLLLCVISAVAGCEKSTTKEVVVKKGETTASGDASSADAAAAPEIEVAEIDLAGAEADQPAKKSGNAKKSKPQAEGKVTLEAAFAEAQEKLQKDDLAGAVEALEKALPDNPENGRLLLILAQLHNAVGRSVPDKPDYPRFVKAADYVRQVVKLEPDLAENPGFRDFAGTIYYNEACALAHEKKPEEALKRLREATESGYGDFNQMEKDADLEQVRALPEFAEFLSKAREAVRERLMAEVNGIFEESKPFEFDFDVTDLEGKKLTNADFKDKVLIVDVWGTWCPPCRKEIPHFVALQKKFGEAGLAIVGLNEEGIEDAAEATKTVETFYKEQGMNYPCALVSGEMIREKIPDLEGFPTTLFFDRSGKVRAKVVGYHDYELLELMVQKLLDEKLDPSKQPDASEKPPATDKPAADEKPDEAKPADKPAAEKFEATEKADDKAKPDATDK